MNPNPQRPGYNTQNDDMLLPEYGRHVHRMAQHLRDIPDAQERSRAAHQIIEVMSMLNPQSKEASDQRQKLWDHLHLMAGSGVELDSPFPKPEHDPIFHTASRPEYPNQNIRIRHYGKIVEEFITATQSMPDGPERQALAEQVANFMKMSYRNWNKIVLNDEDVFQDLRKLSNGQISLSSEDTVLGNSFSGHHQIPPSAKKPFKGKPKFKGKKHFRG
jgi:hypothetical protein